MEKSSPKSKWRHCRYQRTRRAKRTSYEMSTTRASVQKPQARTTKPRLSRSRNREGREARGERTAKEPRSLELPPRVDQGERSRYQMGQSDGPWYTVTYRYIRKVEPLTGRGPKCTRDDEDTRTHPLQATHHPIISCRGSTPKRILRLPAHQSEGTRKSHAERQAQTRPTTCHVIDAKADRPPGRTHSTTEHQWRSRSSANARWHRSSTGYMQWGACKAVPDDSKNWRTHKTTYLVNSQQPKTTVMNRGPQASKSRPKTPIKGNHVPSANDIRPDGENSTIVMTKVVRTNGQTTDGKRTPTHLGNEIGDLQCDAERV
jgi:hypothetical protein